MFKFRSWNQLAAAGIPSLPMPQSLINALKLQTLLPSILVVLFIKKKIKRINGQVDKTNNLADNKMVQLINST